MISAAIPHDLLGAPEHATSSRRPWRREPPRSSPRHLPPFTVVTGRRGRSPAGDTQPRGAGRRVCLTQQPPPVSGCVTEKFHSACAARLLRGRGRRYPRSYSHAGLPAPAGGQVVRRLPGRHSSVAARPLRCWSGLSVGRRGSGRPPLGVHRWSFCPQARKDTSLEQYVGRLNHDRTTVRHWQSPSSPRRVKPTPRVLGQLLCDYHQPLLVPCGASWAPSDDPDGAVMAKVCMTTGVGQTQGTLLGVPVTPSFGGPPAAGRQRDFSWVASTLAVESHLGSSDVICHCGGTGGPGPVRASALPLWRQRSHLPHTSVGVLR